MLNYDELAEAMGNLEEDTMVEILEGVMKEGGAEASAALEACQKGMDMVGKLFEEGEYYVGDLIYAGELMTQAVQILKEALISKEGESSAKVPLVICTVKNDLHDIGKNIVKAMLEAAGFDVIDLGIDVSAEKVVEAVKNSGARIVTLSGVLTLAIDSMKETIDALKKEKLDVKVLIGGAPVSENARIMTGADEWAHSPQKTIQTCKAWAGM